MKVRLAARINVETDSGRELVSLSVWRETFESDQNAIEATITPGDDVHVPLGSWFVAYDAKGREIARHQNRVRAFDLGPTRQAKTLTVVFRQVVT
jgi:hypothetical protein